MPLQFKSKQIDKTVNIDELEKLRPSELLLLKDELQFAIKNMNSSLLEVAAQKKRDGEDYNQQWHRKVRRKQKVCQAFLEEIANLDEVYEAIYQKNFMTFLTQYISTQELDEIIKKAKIQTDLKKFNVVAVKQSLEDEGVSQEDLILMKKILKVGWNRVLDNKVQTILPDSILLPKI